GSGPPPAVARASGAVATGVGPVASGRRAPHEDGRGCSRDARRREPRSAARGEDRTGTRTRHGALLPPGRAGTAAPAPDRGAQRRTGAPGGRRGGAGGGVG